MTDYLKELFASQEYDESNFFLIAGPCVVESEELLFQVAEKVSGICKKLRIPYIFKSSYRKAHQRHFFYGIGR
jgi:2-dehydro-3-deoxyphosphooctonate aldolase (KDO 8-P synthase)